MKQSAILAPFYLSVSGCSLLQSEVLGQRDHAQQLWSISLQSIEIHLRQLSRGNLARAKKLGELRDRRKREIFDSLELRQLHFSKAKFGLRNVELFFRTRRMECDRRFSVERNVDLPIRLI